MSFFYNILNTQEDQKEDDDSSAFEELGRLGEEIDLLPDKTNAEPEKQRKQGRFTNKERPEEKRIQYTTRGKRQTYCEAEVPNDDHYICKLDHLETFSLVLGKRRARANKMESKPFTLVFFKSELIIGT